MIVPAVDEIAYLFKRQARRFRAVQHVAIGKTLGEHRTVGDALLIGTVEIRDRIRRRRACRGDFAQILDREAGIAEKGVGKDFAEHRQRLRLIVTPERPEFDVVDLGELQEHLNGHRSLVSLDQIKVTGGDAEIGCHTRLGEAAFAPKPPNARAGKDFFLRGHGSNPMKMPATRAIAGTLIYKIYIINRIARESCEVFYFNIFNNLGNIGHSRVEIV